MTLEKMRYRPDNKAATFGIIFMYDRTLLSPCYACEVLLMGVNAIIIEGGGSRSVPYMLTDDRNVRDQQHSHH